MAETSAHRFGNIRWAPSSFALSLARMSSSCGAVKQTSCCGAVMQMLVSANRWLDMKLKC